MQGFFITSNNTNSGKTFVACQIILAIKDFYNLKVYKPLETGCQSINNKLQPEDAIKLNHANGNKQHIDQVCPYRFSLYASGEIASANSNINLADLTKNINGEFNIVEGAGGFFSPIIKNKLNSDLALKLGLPIIIVIDDVLGAVSESLLTINAVQNKGLDIFAVILNQKTKNSLNNLSALQQYTDVNTIIFNTEKIIDFNSSLVSLLNSWRAD